MMQSFVNFLTSPRNTWWLVWTTGILAIQLKNHPETIPSLMGRLVNFLIQNPEQEFYRGKLIIVEPHRVRIRQ